MTGQPAGGCEGGLGHDRLIAGALGDGQRLAQHVR